MYIHASVKKIKNIYNVKQTNKIFKPLGLWYSLNNEWINYVHENNMDKTYKFFYEIKVTYTKINNPDKNKVLLIKSNKDFQLLMKKYFRINEYSNGYISIDCNWENVEKDFAGIEIINLKKLKLSNKTIQYIEKKYKNSLINEYLLWTQTLDIDSGVVWNISALKYIKLIKL